MTTTPVTSIAGFVPGDGTAGSGNGALTPSNVANINAFIAAMAPGDELIFDRPFVTNATIVIQNKLGIRVHGASPYGARIRPNGDFDAVRYENNEYCIFEGYGVWPGHVQAAGIGHKIIEGASATVSGLNNKYRDLMCADRTRQQSRWGLGSGRPYKGFEVSGTLGGYNSVARECQAQGCVSDGWSVGTYGQSTRGTVGFQLSKCESAAGGGQGFAIFCSEALTMTDGTEALANLANGLLTYPDNGGTVEVFIDRGSFDTNWGNGTLLQAGGAGAGGKVLSFVAHNTWWGNNGNAEMRPGGSTGVWNLVHGFTIDTSQVSRIKEVRMIDNRSAVNALCGYVIGAYERLDFEGNVAQNNAQYGAGSAWGIISNCPLPVGNSILDNTADGTATAPYPGALQAGIAIVASMALPYAEGNASMGNWAGLNYSFATTPPGFVGGAVQNNT